MTSLVFRQPVLDRRARGQAVIDHVEKRLMTFKKLLGLHEWLSRPLKLRAKS